MLGPKIFETFFIGEPRISFEIINTSHDITAAALDNDSQRKGQSNYHKCFSEKLGRKLKLFFNQGELFCTARFPVKYKKGSINIIKLLSTDLSCAVDQSPQHQSYFVKEWHCTNESNPHSVKFLGRSKIYLTRVKYCQNPVFLMAIVRQKDGL